MLLLGPGNKKINKSLAELKKKKVAVIAENESSLALIRSILDVADGSDAGERSRWRRRAQRSTSCLPSGNGFSAGDRHRPRLEGGAG